MAVLNYSSQYSDIQSFISSLTNVVSADNLLRLFFSPDTAGAGHLITHGIDFTPDYNSGRRGLVPANSGTLNATYLRGDGWAALWNQTDEDSAKNTGSTDALKAANLEKYLTTTIVSAKVIQSWITLSFAALNAMRFKGTISVSGTTVTGVNGGSNGFPKECVVGDTYKVSGTGTLGGLKVASGDMLVCIKAGNTGDLNKSEYWTIVQDNVEALVTHLINGTDYHFYSSDANLASGLSIYAPTSSGTKDGLVLLSKANNPPIWAELTLITAGKVQNALSGGTGITLKLAGGTSTTYDGQYSVSVNLNPATTSTLGGVKLVALTLATLWGDTGADKDTTKATLSINNSGDLYITRLNVVNALGYVPESAANAYKIILAASATDKTQATTLVSNPYINLLKGANVDSNIKLLGDINNGSGSISVNGKDGVVSILARTFTDSLDGIVPHIVNVSGGTSNNIANLTAALRTSIYLLGSDAKWYQLPESAFLGTWRNIKVGGTEILSTAPKDSSGKLNPALDLISGGKTTLTPKKDALGNYTGEVQISSTWRDILLKNSSNNKLEPISDDNGLAFEDSDGIFIHAETQLYTSGSVTKNATVIKSYLVWYNVDTNTYDGIV